MGSILAIFQINSALADVCARRMLLVRLFYSFIMPPPRGHHAMMLSNVCLTSDICCVHPVDGRRVRPAGWMARIG